jgi:hypothetical protein
VIARIAPTHRPEGATIALSGDDPDQQGTSTLEVRWILPGPVTGPTMAWFRRFPTSIQTRVDAYILTPRLDGLSLKIRADADFDVKAYRGSPGVLEVPGHATGRLEAWEKWSFPLGVQSERADESATWRRVRKVRRISWFVAPDDWFASADGLDQRARCAVELTDIMMGGKAWWTLGLEASGPSLERRGVLEAAAASVFAEPRPGGAALRLEDSRPYAAWLRQPRETT